MIFDSLAFAVFLPIVFLLYWKLPQKYRWILLLLANYYFYMSFSPEYVILLLITTGVSYSCALLIKKSEKIRNKKILLGVGIIISLSFLLFYKYASFFTDNIEKLLKSIALPLNDVTLQLLLPIGISFYTFKTISYMVDSYRGKIEPEKHFGYYASYLSFFPTLVSGPIDRAADTIPMIKADKKFSYEDAVYSLRLMVVGFAKKILIADVLSKYVNMVFDNVYEYSGITLMIGAVLFTFQIYCDFSGYSDIAIGTAGLLGIPCKRNFNSPYFAASVKEFWSRWHISLSTWFRDYVYIPLGGSRVKPWRTQLNVMITFLISGLWHGANWTFVIWGGIHGFYQVIENLLLPKGKGKENRNFLKPLRIVITFCLVTIAWIFFRADSVEDAMYVVTAMWNDFSVRNALANLSMTFTGILKIVPFLTALMIYDYISLKKDLLREMSKWKWPIRWIIYIGIVLLMIVLKIHNGTSQQFIYFQF